MLYDEARARVILYSLLITAVLLPFFILAPAIGYPMSNEQAYQVVSLIIPVFLGYLGSGVAYIFNQPIKRLPAQTPANRDLLSLCLNGIFIVFSLSFAALLLSFYSGNRRSADPGIGMEFPTFMNYLTVLLGLLTTVVGAAVTFLGCPVHC